jgi:fructosamine-3-kinase
VTGPVVVAGRRIDAAQRVPGGDICDAVRGSAAGRPVFAKTLRGAPAGFFAADARGLEFIRIDGGPPVPAVVAVGADGLVLEWIEPGVPTAPAAETFGRMLAVLHRHAPPGFGADSDGFIGSLPLDNAAGDDWASFYVERRVAPYLGALSPAQRATVEELCARIDDVAGPPEPPARIHGDLWSGNLVWAADETVWLVDAASAHGGHRETDLAMLALFGAPHVDQIIAAYQDTAPLADGWRARLPLHQLHPMLVHAAMFGGGYGERAAHAARAALAAG